MNFRRSFLLLLAALFVVVAAVAQPVSDFYHKTEYRIAMRDSVQLYTAVYCPKSPADAPMLILRTPYGCRPYGEAKFAPGLESGYLRSYVDRGYIIVLQDVRGRHMSQGEYVNVRPAGWGDIDESTDSYDTVDWLLANVAGHNGRVGFVGCSYPGFYAMMGALSGHPAVKAVSAQAPVTDWYMGDDTHHNGVLMLTDTFGFIPGMSHAGEHTPCERMPAKRSVACTPDEYRFFLGVGTLDSLTRLLDPTPFWDQMAAHPDYDQWWQSRDLRRACHNVRPAVLVVGGAFDAEDCFGAWNLYRAIVRQSPSTDCRLVAGPWAHGAWLNGGRKLGAFDFGAQASSEYYLEHFEHPFFDYHLRGIGAADSLPKVAVFTSGDDRWRSFDRWTPRSARRETFFLTQGGRLTTQPPTAKKSLSSYTSDPANPVPYNHPLTDRRAKEYMVADQRFVADRRDVLSFVTDPLTADMTLVGPVTAAIEAAISTTDADLVVKLIDVFPDDDPKAGYQMLVRGDVMRIRYRDGFSRPRAAVPGEVMRVEFTLPDIAHTFRAGHRLMVQVQSSWFPLAERSPQQFINLWHCKASDFVPCEVQIYHQQSNASSITVHRVN